MLTRTNPVIWTAGSLKQYDSVRIEPAADDDVLDAVQAWVDHGCPRGGMLAERLLRDIERTGLYRERCIVTAEESASVMRKAEDAHDSRKAEGM